MHATENKYNSNIIILHLNLFEGLCVMDVKACVTDVREHTMT